jgi:hypothetical protein
MNEFFQSTTTCPHCGKTGQYAILCRWHFDNCPDYKKAQYNKKLDDWLSEYQISVERRVMLRLISDSTLWTLERQFYSPTE